MDYEALILMRQESEEHGDLSHLPEFDELQGDGEIFGRRVLKTGV